jgi:hypothetical protein
MPPSMTSNSLALLLSLAAVAVPVWAQEIAHMEREAAHIEREATYVAREATYIARVVANLQQMDAVDLDADWYVVMTAQQDTELLVTESDPARLAEERRLLRTVNGEVPSAKRLLAFRKQEKKRLEDAQVQKETLKYSYLVDAATLRLVTEVGSRATLSFSPAIQAFESDRENLAGSVVLNMETGILEKISMNNTGELSPAFSVSIDAWEMVLSFATKRGALLPAQMTTSITGTYGFVKGFDSVSVIEFSEYRSNQ